MEKYSFHRVNLGQNKEEHYEEERKKRSRKTSRLVELEMEKIIGKSNPLQYTIQKVFLI